MKQAGYHIRSGAHNLTHYDWQQFLMFADERMHKVEKTQILP